ncbi:MAG: AraC family transcriptional regulator [Myxococcota bacterium]
MDVLSDIIRATSHQTVLLARFDYWAPWGVSLGSARAAGLHYIEAGSCWLRLEDKAVELRQGDVVFLPHGTPHSLSDSPTRTCQPLHEFLAEEQATKGELTARIVCARKLYRTDPPELHPFLRALPPVVHVPSPSVNACPTLSPCLRLLLQEVGNLAPGHAAVTELLLEAFLVYVIRNWVETEGGLDGWPGALRDPRIARSLSAMHDEVHAEWSVSSLAKVAGMSRAAFAKRFRALLGSGPLAYLTELRMRRGAEYLRDTDDTLAEIAQRVGYTSEFAFSRAFKRHVGCAPSHYR